MQQSHNTMSIKTLCAMAGVSRSGYYAYHTGWDGMSISVDTENVMCPLLWGTKPGNVQNQGYHFSVGV